MEQDAIDPVIVQSHLQNQIQNSPGVSLFDVAGMRGLGALSLPYLDPTDNTVKTTDSFTAWMGFIGEYVMANPMIALGIGGLLVLTVFNSGGRRGRY